MKRVLRVLRVLRVPRTRPWRSSFKGSSNLSTRAFLAGAGAFLAGAAVLSGGCSGGGDGGGGGLGGAFGLQGSSVSNGQVWQLNRPIEFTFTQPVDFATVNSNTINISDLAGRPAAGTFSSSPLDAKVVFFRPRCPTEPDFGDAGLKPGGIQYRIRIPDASTGAGSVRSTTGEGIAIAQTITFSTPVSTAPSELFLDPVAGPPTPIAGFTDPNGVVRGTRLVYSDGSLVLPFALDLNGFGVLPPEDPSDPMAPPQRVPMNLYSDVSTRFSIIIELNQPVLPTAENVSAARVQIQFLNGGVWIPFSTRVELLANCTATGAAVEVIPVGVLPQNRMLRVWLGPEFEDLVGDRNILALTDFATMESDFVTADGTPGGEPLEFADEKLEEFQVGAASPDSFEDTQALSSLPRAKWGGGLLSPAFEFEGTGGPNGTFDWHIPPNTEVVLDTVSTLIFGGPGGLPTSSQLVVNGLVNIRDLKIPAGSKLRIEGPNPARFLCAGSVQIDGTLTISGRSAQPVFSLDMPHVPEPGAEGNGGGGAGGIGSFLTNQTTPRGGTGRGAFGVAGGGGEGGESGWHPDGSNNGVLRRAAGGGGGTFGPDSLVTGPGGSICADQTLIGLDAESGFPGAVTANAATRIDIMPWGGFQGPRPFTDLNGIVDDFWGTMVRNFGTENAILVLGELESPWAGAGGGAGGDATRADSYPPPQLIFADQDKGAGGGGGAGSLTLLALGDIKLGSTGRIEAIGGHGSGGENTSGTNRIGGGSGGGSGGHIVMQTASRIDLSALALGVTAISARGGQGGAGEDDTGGAASSETIPALDALHVGLTMPLADNPWIEPVPEDCLNTGVGVIRGAGGDGGPGIVQLHVGSLPGDILYPGGGGQANLRDAARPIPVGYDAVAGSWVDHLLPVFGRFSQGQSKWIPLGGVVYSPGDQQVLDPITFLFGGTEPDGFVQSTGGVVDDLEPLLAPAGGLQDPGLPAVDPENPRRLLLDASPLAGDDAIYRLNPNLFRRFRVRVGELAFQVETAQILPGGMGLLAGGSDVLALDVDSTGPVLPSQGLVRVVPRYFAISTDGLPDALSPTSTVKIDFQATTADAIGLPDESGIFPGPQAPENEGWASDITTLNFPANTDFQFFRFRLIFDLAASGEALTVGTPRPDVDFLRVPFRF